MLGTLSVPKWDVILKGESYIASEVFQIHPEMHETDGRSSWKHLSINYWSHWVLSHFLPRLALKLHTKYHILDTLSVQKIGCWTAMRDIHCSWSASKPSIVALSRWDKLPCAFLETHVGLTKLCYTDVDSQITNKCRFWVSSQYGKYWVLNCEERHP